PEPISALLNQQVREPLEELQARTAIPRLTPIEGDVSASVRQLYEENPYPRWIKLPPVTAQMTFDAYLSDALPKSDFVPLAKTSGIDILVGGCGTGRHSIDSSRHQGAQVLAIDLSLTSLAYAQRQTRALGIANIRYAQADITKLDGFPH